MLAILMPSHAVPCASCCMQDLAPLRFRLSSSSERNPLGCACRVKAGFVCANYCKQCASRCDVFPVRLHAVPGESSCKM